MSELYTIGSVCSGMEAASVALNPLGFETVWLSEIEPAPCSVLANHHPNVPNLGDMRKIAALVRDCFIPAPDMLCGGTPCQAFSIAGLRNSLDDARGNLTLVFCEIADEIDNRRAADGLLPCTILWENVPGVLNTEDNAFGCFLAGLAGEDDPLQPPGKKWENAGCVYGPKRAVAWRVFDAQYFGVAQRRRRVFVIASAREGFDPAAVLFEFDGMRRDIAPSRKTGQEPTGSLTASSGRRGGVDDPERGTMVPIAFGGNNQSGSIDIATARNACGSGSGRLDFESETFLVQEISGTLQAAGKAAGSATQQDAESGLLIPVGAKGARYACLDCNLDFNDEYSDGAQSLAPAECPQCGDENEIVDRWAVSVSSVLSVALRGREGGATAELGDEIAGTLRASGGGGDKAHVLAPICFSSKDYGGDAMVDCSPTLRARNHDKSHANAGSPPAIAFDSRQDTVSSTEVFGALGSSSPQAQALCIHADAVGRTGDAITPSADSEGRVRLRNPGMGIIDDGTTYNLMATGQPHAVCVTGDIAHTLKAEGFDASEDGTGRGQPIVAAAREVAGCITSNYGKQLDNSDTALGPNVAIHGMAVRRLMPVECLRLQGYPDDFFVGVLHRGKPLADGPMYKMIGNSWAVPNIVWIGKRIRAALDRGAA